MLAEASQRLVFKEKLIDYVCQALVPERHLNRPNFKLCVVLNRHTCHILLLGARLRGHSARYFRLSDEIFKVAKLVFVLTAECDD